MSEEESKVKVLLFLEVIINECFWENPLQLEVEDRCEKVELTTWLCSRLGLTQLLYLYFTMLNKWNGAKNDWVTADCHQQFFFESSLRLLSSLSPSLHFR